MKKKALVLLFPFALLLASCSSMFPFTPTIGMQEKKWLRHTVASDVVYIDGSVKAYRSGGSYYYFKDGVLAKVTPSLLSAEKI